MLSFVYGVKSVFSLQVSFQFNINFIFHIWQKNCYLKEISFSILYLEWKQNRNINEKITIFSLAKFLFVLLETTRYRESFSFNFFATDYKRKIPKHKNCIFLFFYNLRKEEKSEKLLEKILLLIFLFFLLKNQKNTKIQWKFYLKVINFRCLFLLFPDLFIKNV